MRGWMDDPLPVAGGGEALGLSCNPGPSQPACCFASASACCFASASAIAAAVDSETAEGKTYELGGPRIYTFNELYDIILKTIDLKRFKIPVPFFAARPLGYLIGAIWRYVPPFAWGALGNPPLTGSQVELLQDDNVVAKDALTIRDLGVTDLESVEAIVPRYLWRFRTYGEFHKPSEA